MAVRNSLATTETATGSVPWPYTTPGIFPSFRKRRVELVPVVRPGSATSVVSGMRELLK
jgi:hypothetical protein